MKALRCPFLTTIPMTHLRRFAPQVLPYAQQCPIMGHALKYSSLADSGEGKITHYVTPLCEQSLYHVLGVKLGNCEKIVHNF